MVLLWSGANVMGLPQAGTAARPTKRFVYAIYDGMDGIGRFPGTATLLGFWFDASPPKFSISANGGTSEMVVTRTCTYGALDEPDEPASRGTVRDGNRVDVYIADIDTFDTGDPATYGYLLYRGTIEKWNSRLTPAGETFTIRIQSLHRLAQQSWIRAETTITPGGAGTPHKIVTDYLLGLDWDANNPTSPVPTLTADITFKRTTVAAALQKVVEEMGPDWVWFITPQGTVRFFQQSRTETGRTGASGSIRHILSFGGERATVAELELEKDNSARVKRVNVVYATGETEKHALDYDANDPREVYVTAEDRNLTGADALAQALLDQWDRVILRGSALVLDGAYDIESFTVGDVCRILVERPLGTGGSGYQGYEDYNDQDVIIMGLSYEYDQIRLELESVKPRTADLLWNLTQRATDFMVQAADTQLKRESATVLSTDSSDLKVNGIVYTGDENTATPRGAGVGTVKFADGTSRDSAGFGRLDIGGTDYFVPLFPAN